MGTNFRGRKFLDVAWRALDDQGFLDRKCWIRAAAAAFRLDLSRVGIFGGSAGGQAAMRALLDHGDLYRVAAADCGCHDNRLDKIWWNEQWMGPDISHECYARCSNVENAHKLHHDQRLLLTVGELDTNVDPATTLRVAGALQKAKKQNFELCIVVGEGHGAADTPFGRKKRRDFLVRELVF
jgi:dipeptidyl aminopeptidase/acylaminoacyl peptidase